MTGINVFIEGPNGSGKSMLADYMLRDRYLARQTLKGMAQVTVEKYEQLDQEWELWRVCLASDFPRKAADVIYTSVDHADLLDTAQKIAALVKQREDSIARR